MSTKLHKLDWYEDLVADLFDNPDNSESRKVWSIIDRMANCELDIPANLLEFVGENAKFATPLVSDSIKAVKRFLGNRLPVLSVMPMRPTSQEKERMEFLEDSLYWHFVLMNKRDAESTHSKITNSAARYGAIAFKTRYLPFEAKRKTKDEMTDNGNGYATVAEGKDLYDEATKKNMLRFGDFDWPVYHPANVYPVWSNGVLTSATAMIVRSVWEVVREFGEDSDVAIELVKQLKNTKKDILPSDLRTNYVSYFDYTGCYDRAIWMTLNGSDTGVQTGGSDPIEVVREEHKRGWVNWVIKDNGEPICGTVVASGLYDHLGQVTAVTNSKLLQYAAQKNDVYNTANPNNPNILSESGVGSEEILDNQTTHQRLQPSPPDPSLLALKMDLGQQLAMSLGVTPLLNLSDASGSAKGNFSAINAIQSTAVVQLSPIQGLIERAEEEGLHQACRWIFDSKESSTGYRMKNRGQGMSGTQGMPIVMTGTNNEAFDPSMQNVVMFDPADIFITVKLSPASISDKQAAAALAQQQQAAGYSRARSLEESGVDNVDLEMEQRAEEMLFEAEVQADVQKKIKEVEVWAQAQIMQLQAQLQQAQMQAQQQQAQGQPQQPTSPETANREARNPPSPQQGMDSRQGAPSPAQMGAPNRVQANGRSDSGQAIV